MIESFNLNNKMDVILSETIENLDTADDLVTAFLQEKNFTSDLFSCRMLLREGLMNALVHGCDSDHNLIVKMIAVVTGENVYLLKIIDPDKEFVWQKNGANVPDAKQAYGRGMAIIKRYSDSIEYNDSGNVIIMTKNLAHRNV